VKILPEPLKDRVPSLDGSCGENQPGEHSQMSNRSNHVETHVLAQVNSISKS